MHSDRRAADRFDTPLLVDSFEIPKSDREGQCKTFFVGAAYWPIHTSRKTLTDQQPLRSDRGNAVLFDGRLDNREELLRSLDQSPFSRCSDTAIVLGAYERFGRDSFARLIGDFAFSIWDATQRILVLVRDPFGIRTLFYRPLRDGFSWSTSLRVILSLSGDVPKVNDRYVLDFLVGETGVEETPYEGIHSVRPGTSVIAKVTGEVGVLSHWNPVPTHYINYFAQSSGASIWRAVMRRCALTTQVSLLEQPTERSTILYSLKRQVELLAACASRNFLPFDILVFGLTIFTGGGE